LQNTLHYRVSKLIDLIWLD